MKKMEKQRFKVDEINKAVADMDGIQEAIQVITAGYLKAGKLGSGVYMAQLFTVLLDPESPHCQAISDFNKRSMMGLRIALNRLSEKYKDAAEQEEITVNEREEAGGSDKHTSGLS